MYKINSILLFLLIFCNHGFADSYYFKQCKINENAFGNYIIDFENGEIKVTLKTTEGSSQEITDKIKKVTEDQVVTEKIQSSKGENFYFVYFLDANSKSVIKQNYKKISGIDLFQPDGPKRQSYCDDVKADWDKDKIEKAKIKKEQKQISQTQEKILKEESSEKPCEGNDHKKWTKCQGSYTAKDGSKYIGEFNNGNLLIDQFLFNLDKLGAADLTGEINNDEKFSNLKFESNIFVDNKTFSIG